MLEEQRLVVAQRAGQRAALLAAVHDAREVVEDRVIVVERAGVLTQRLEQTAGGRPRTAAPGVGVRDRGDVGPRPVDLGVDRERRRVHGSLTGEEAAFQVDEQQVGGAEVAPAPPERVEPEPVRELGVADRDVAGDPVVVPQLREEAVRDRQPALAVGAFVLDRRERRRRHGRARRQHARGGPSPAPLVLVTRRAARARTRRGAVAVDARHLQPSGRVPAHEPCHGRRIRCSCRGGYESSSTSQGMKGRSGETSA